MLFGFTKQGVDMQAFVLASFLVVGIAFGQRDVWDIMGETNARMEVFENQTREMYKNSTGADSWKCLAVANAISKNQWLLIAQTLRTEDGKKKKDYLTEGIESARDELRSYLMISVTRDQINGVLEALEYGERELKKARIIK